MNYLEFRGPSANGLYEYSGLSLATKPTINIPLHTKLYEYDRMRGYIWDGNNWILSAVPSCLTSITTIELNKAASAYDLWTNGSSDIQVLSLSFISIKDLTGDLAGSLTSIAIKSTDDTPVTFISATAGAKANLSEGKHLQYNGQDVVAAGKKIQLTIAGGATGSSIICPVFMAYQEVVS